MLWYDKNIIHNIYYLFNNKRHEKFCYNVVTTTTSKGKFTMPPQDVTTFMLSLPSECKDFSQKGVILFTIPVSPHACPRCHELTSRVHDYRCQPIKTCLTLHTRKQIIYQKRRYRCPECKKYSPRTIPSSQDIAASPTPTSPRSSTTTHNSFLLALSQKGTTFPPRQQPVCSASSAQTPQPSMRPSP